MTTIAAEGRSAEQEILEFVVDCHLVLPILLDPLLQSLLHLFPRHHSRLPLLFLEDIIGSPQVQRVFFVLDAGHATRVAADVVFHSRPIVWQLLH